MFFMSEVPLYIQLYDDIGKQARGGPGGGWGALWSNTLPLPALWTHCWAELTTLLLHYN